MAKKITRNYETGYCQPPVQSQFPPGKSGNIKGRPKGSKNTATLLKEILSKKTQVRKGKSTRRITNEQKILEKLVDQAAEGDSKARRDLMEYREKMGPSETSPQKTSPPAKIFVYRIPDNGRLMDPSVIVGSPVYDFEVKDSAPDTGKD